MTKKFGFVIRLSVFLAALLMGGQSQVSQPEFAVKSKFNVRIPMRDGVELSADMFMPDATGKFPAILIRTPYDNNSFHRAMAARF